MEYARSMQQKQRHNHFENLKKLWTLFGEFMAQRHERNRTTLLFLFCKEIYGKKPGWINYIYE